MSSSARHGLTATPDFVIAGAPKCGTTSLHHWLDQHPGVHMLPGEPHFFAHDLAYNQPAMPARRYATLCRAARPGQCCGDRSTWYLYSRVASSAIRAANPAARILILVRQPAEMLYSLHAHLCRRGQRETMTDLRQAMALEGERKRGRRLPARGGFPEKFQYSMLADYAAGVQRFVDDFGPEQVRIVLFDDLRDRPLATFSDILAFLGLDPGFQPQLDVYNRSAPVPDSLFRRLWRRGTWRYTIRRLRPAWYQKLHLQRKQRVRADRDRDQPWPALDHELRRELTERFEQQILTLEDLIGRDLAHWRQDAGQ
ncbi:sulfotransferase family protein [Wenzhouxiangella limi]|uniref:Sulfotransferase n=1 Tax=Wenzhouxiangella limi TaxID=2707351 RepID=A0A845VB29_9GAMM|nr:sulfotransferase [Wenzhouxiangella limi]NDY94519.1 sulfotransferase [Wenzhouxiangella limi]